MAGHPWTGYPGLPETEPALVGGRCAHGRGIRYAASSFAKKLGYDPDELIGEHCTEITHAQDRNLLSDRGQRLRDGQVVRYRKRYWHSSGSFYIPFDFVVYPVPDVDDVDDVLGVAFAREVTAVELGDLADVLVRRVSGSNGESEVEVVVRNKPEYSFRVSAPVFEEISARAGMSRQSIEHELFAIITAGIDLERGRK